MIALDENGVAREYRINQGGDIYILIHPSRVDRKFSVWVCLTPIFGMPYIADPLDMWAPIALIPKEVHQHG